MKQILFNEVNPTDYKGEIIEGVKMELVAFKKSFQPKHPTEYLTRQEVARLLSISLVTLYNWTKSNIITAYRIGNLVRYKRQDIENCLTKINSK